MSGRTTNVAIESSPPQANVSVQDKRGNVVATATTPAVVSLQRGDGYFKPARYTATIEKSGFERREVNINPRLNPWILGNVLIGGVVGLVVDPITGAMWRLTPTTIQADLSPMGTPLIGSTDADRVQPAVYADNASNDSGKERRGLLRRLWAARPLHREAKQSGESASAAR